MKFQIPDHADRLLDQYGCIHADVLAHGMQHVPWYYSKRRGGVVEGRKEEEEVKRWRGVLRC